MQQYPLHMHKKLFHILGRRRQIAQIARLERDLAAGFSRHPQFIGNELHCRGQIQRTVFRVGRDIDVVMAERELIIEQAMGFATEQDGGRQTSRLITQGFGDLARIAHFKAQAAQAGRGANDSTAAGNGSFDAVMYGRRFQHIEAATTTGPGFAINRFARVDQPQIGQPHGFHGPGDRTDIAGVLGVAEDDADLVEHERRRLWRVSIWQGTAGWPSRNGAHSSSSFGNWPVPVLLL